MKHANFKSILEARLKLLKTVMDWWRMGNQKEALHSLGLIQDVGVIADFLRSVLTD